MAEYKVLKNVTGSSLLYGDTVYFTESGEQIPYILVHPGNNGNFLFMRKYAPMDRVEFFEESANINTSSEERIYAGNTLDKFMSNTFFNRFTSEWQRVFVDNYITVTKIEKEKGVGYTISRKIFAASATELGVGEQDNGTIPTESPFGAYQYFKTNAQSKRKCRLKNENGDYVQYWTRSKNNHTGITFNYYALSIDRNGDYDTGTWQKNPYFVRPVISINENVTIVKETSGWRIIPNLPPQKPLHLGARLTKKNGEEYNVSWPAFADIDGPDTIKYRVQKKVDSGEWYNFLEISDTSFSRTLSYKEAEEQIQYRVQAFDRYNNESDWLTVATIAVANNLPPSAPSYLTVNGKYKGEKITVTWGESTDVDGNLDGYYLYRSTNGGGYVQIPVTSRRYTELAGDWNTVKYKVCAYDKSGAKSEAKETSISLTNRITMEIAVLADSDFTDKKEFGFSGEDTETDLELKFSVSDTASNESYAVEVYLDNDVLIGSSSGVSKGNFTFVVDKDMWQKILNGKHTIDIFVYNSQGHSVSKSLTFNKKVTGVCFTLKNPVTIESSEVVSKFLVNVVGSFPTGSSLEVKVTNNANDNSPVWQTVSSSELNTNEFVEFANKTAVNGSAFNIIVKAERNTAKGDCFISSVNGMFGRNLFEYIFERLDALEAGAANA